MEGEGCLSSQAARWRKAWEPGGAMFGMLAKALRPAAKWEDTCSFEVAAIPARVKLCSPSRWSGQGAKAAGVQNAALCRRTRWTRVNFAWHAAIRSW